MYLCTYYMYICIFIYIDAKEIVQWVGVPCLVHCKSGLFFSYPVSDQ